MWMSCRPPARVNLTAGTDDVVGEATCLLNARTPKGAGVIYFATLHDRAFVAHQRNIFLLTILRDLEWYVYCMTLHVEVWARNKGNLYFLRLVQEGFELVAMDLPGHGRSEHMSKDAWYSVLDYPEYVIEAAR